MIIQIVIYTAVMVLDLMMMIPIHLIQVLYNQKLVYNRGILWLIFSFKAVKFHQYHHNPKVKIKHYNLAIRKLKFAQMTLINIRKCIDILI